MGTDEDGYIYIRAEDDWIEDVNQEFRDWKEKSDQESLNGENGETEAGKPIILGQTLKEETDAAIHDFARSVIRAPGAVMAGESAGNSGKTAGLRFPISRPFDHPTGLCTSGSGFYSGKSTWT